MDPKLRAACLRLLGLGLIYEIKNQKDLDLMIADAHLVLNHESVATVRVLRPALTHFQRYLYSHEDNWAMIRIALRIGALMRNYSAYPCDWYSAVYYLGNREKPQSRM